MLDRQEGLLRLEPHHHPLLGARVGLDQPAQREVPEVALERREPDRAKLAANPGERPAKVGRVIDEVRDQAPGVRAGQSGLGVRPISPVLAEDRLLGSGVGAVRGGGLGDGQAEGLLVVPLQPRLGDEPSRKADGAEPLVVEVVREAVAFDRGERPSRAVGGLAREVADHDLKAVPPEVGRSVGMGEEAEWLQFEVRLAERPHRPLDDGEVLRRLGVSVP